ncbi:hypothetical protein MSKOL_1354 [Methanosarcina sp. Kolksee]|uniref:hypothetical protein n=1 Tax=Methanosarcina sp. Kolksee TaxID=1434099 RepID=UPI000615C504|nr:hypothetical protein [Methanosarcina sp. Kolksee]AKB47131.1 hypothetical protein MSKOL_1354 [Methanosarcina sp. Kolksee]
MDKKYLLIGCLCAIFVLAVIFSVLLKPDSLSDSKKLQDSYTLPFDDCCSGFDNTSMNISDNTSYSTYDRNSQECYELSKGDSMTGIEF